MPGHTHARALDSDGNPVITTSGLTKIYRGRGRETTALDGVDLHVREGEVYGVLATEDVEGAFSSR